MLLAEQGSIWSVITLKKICLPAFLILVFCSLVQTKIMMWGGVGWSKLCKNSTYHAEKGKVFFGKSKTIVPWMSSWLHLRGYRSLPCKLWMISFLKDTFSVVLTFKGYQGSGMVGVSFWWNDFLGWFCCFPLIGIDTAPSTNTFRKGAEHMQIEIGNIIIHWDYSWYLLAYGRNRILWCWAF